MKKCVFALLALVVIYILSAIAAWRFLPNKIADAEARHFDVRVAIAQLSHDQQMASDRLKVITSQTLGRGKNKLEEVVAILEDPDLNHLALVYLGSDWSLQRSSFLGQIAHARSLLAAQKEARDGMKSRLAEKIAELEARKRSLMLRLRTPSDERAWHIEMDDIERQLITFRSSNTYNEYLQRDAEEKKHIEATAKNEDNLFRLASDYQTETVGRLNQVLAEKLSDLKWIENEPSRLRRVASLFNIWPLNLVMKLPTEVENEERL